MGLQFSQISPSDISSSQFLERYLKIVQQQCDTAPINIAGLNIETRNPFQPQRHFISAQPLLIINFIYLSIILTHTFTQER